MASVRKRGNSYQITVSVGRDMYGKKIVETATFTPNPGMGKREEKQALNQFVADFEKRVKSGANIKAERMTLRGLSEIYLKDMVPPLLARTTYHDYKKRLEMRILPAMGHIAINSIRQKDINDYKKMVNDTYVSPSTKKPLSPASVTKDCLVISAMLSYAVSEGYLELNKLIYSGKVSKRRKSIADTKPQYFTVEQLIRFIDALNHPIEVVHQEHEVIRRGQSVKIKPYTQTFTVKNKWKVYFYIAMFVGDRRGENISLTWEKLNFETGELYINQSTDYVDGKMELKSTKTHSERCNTLPPFVLDAAKKWKTEQIQECLKMGPDWKGYRGADYDKNFIFTQNNGSQMHICSPAGEYNRIIRLYNQYIAKTPAEQLPTDVSPHGLRHSVAALLISENVDARTVAGILGHANPTTTLNIYSYFFKSKGNQAAKIIEEKLVPTSLFLTR